MGFPSPGSTVRRIRLGVGKEPHDSSDLSGLPFEYIGGEASVDKKDKCIIWLIS